MRIGVSLAGTLAQNILPDPFNSLQAVVDRNLRARVVAAHTASQELRRMNVQGIGHEYWVDAQAGFSADQQRALIYYLLSYQSPL